MFLFRPLPRPASLALLLVASGIFAAAYSPPAADRPVVLVLHGRGMGSQDTASLRRQWLDALNLGLVSVRSDVQLREEDLRLVWYADALDPRAPASCREGRAKRAETATARELGSIFAAVGGLLTLAAEWTGDLEGEALRSVAGDLLFFGEDAKRCAAEERLAHALDAAALERRPVLLIAHSFGSIVAYSHFQLRDTTKAPRVERWITVGSLIGHPELRELLLGGEARRVALPGGVGSWVNVRDPRDPLSAPLVGLRRGATDSGAIVDRVTESRPPGDAHDASRYLADPATARAILEVFRPSTPPTGRSGSAGSAPTDPRG